MQHNHQYAVLNHSPVSRVICKFSSYTAFSLILILIQPIHVASAAIKDSFFSTPQDISRTLDLSSSISGIDVRIVTVSAPPINGSALVIDCDGANVGNGSMQCIVYTPNTNFAGIDNFQVSVDNAGTIEIATVKVTVGIFNVETSGLVPAIEVNNTLSSLCGANAAPEVAFLCQAYNETAALTPEDFRVLINALTPADAAAQGTIGNSLASGQLSNITKHLAALRKGQQHTEIGGLVLIQPKRSINGAMLADLFSTASSGGGAAADNTTSRWGWFINGNIGGGNQNETTFENGFDFSSNGISTGIDYRISSTGVLGFAAGYANTSLDLLYDQGGLEAKGLSFIGYGSYYPTQNSYIDFIVSDNQSEFNSDRRIVFGNTNEIAQSANNSRALAISLASGFNAIQTKNFTTSINLRANYIQTNIKGYTETGDSPFNVTIAEREISQLTSELGVTMSVALNTRSMVLIPQFDFHWVHQFEDEADVIEGYFEVDPEQTSFKFNANVENTDYARAELGISAVSVSGVTSFFQLGSTLFRSDYNNWRAAFGIRLEL